MATRMQQRRGSASQWTSANPILAAGEIGIETDTQKFKIGNGITNWSSLGYFVNAADILDGAPGTLDTLNELAAAINDDPDFFNTVSSGLSAKADSDSPTITGTATFSGTADFTSATVTGIDALPAQDGQSGKYLTTDGSDASWTEVDALPTQTDQSGKYLTTDGSTASWETITTDPTNDVMKATLFFGGN